MILLTAFFLMFANGQGLGDEAQSRLIDKLTRVSMNISPEDSSKVAITLRLGDLHSERGRRLANKELNEGCTVCKAGVKDRKKAIRYYNEVLPGLKHEQRARVLTQIGHLHEVSGKEAKAISIYRGLLKEKSPAITSEAQLSLAEIYFKKRNYAKALTYYTQVKKSHPSQKGLATYRVGWCYFNLGKIQAAVAELKTVLTTKELLSRSQSGIVSVDKMFQEEVSRDLATFMARLPYKPEELNQLYKLSPDNAKLTHLSYIASEYERLGKVPASIAAWNFVIKKQSNPKARLEGHVHLAQLQAQHKDRKAAIKDFEMALSLWGQLGQCGDDTCKQLHTRLRQFVLDWNKFEKKKPSPELLEAYQGYLAVFKDELDMRLWEAQVAAQLKDHELAVQENLVVAKTIHEQTGSGKIEAKKGEWLERSLLLAIENAEATKKKPLLSKTTQAYLDYSRDRKKEMDVRYQRAHMDYEAGKYKEASVAMKDIATNSKAPMGLRTKAADLALDSLVVLKDDSQLESWSKDLSRVLPQKAKSFLGVARKSVLTQSTQLASSNDLSQAWIILNRFDANGASQKEKTTYLKNKLILAEKLKKMPEARDTVARLLRQPGLSVEDKEFALSRKAWLAELQFDFPTALATTKKMKAKSLDPASKSLKMALLAELGKMDATPYYRNFIKYSKDKEKKMAVAAQMVKTSPNQQKELRRYKSLLVAKPGFYTQATFEIYAKTKNKKILTQIVKQPKFVVTPYGKAAQRTLMLGKYEVAKKNLQSDKVNSSTQGRLSRSLKKRIALLGKTEKLAGEAVDQREWASQILLLNLLATENQRFYNEVLSLPVPQGLSPEEEQQYLSLLSQQAAPHQTKANDINGKLKEIYANKDAFTKFKAATDKQVGPVKAVFQSQLETVKSVVPADLQALLSKESAAMANASSKPSLPEIEKARQSVREQPFDKSRLQSLLSLEKKRGSDSMVSYLESRLTTINKMNSVTQ